MAINSNMKINGERLWDSLMEMAKIGPGVAGGNNRQTLTDDDAKGRALFQTCLLYTSPSPRDATLTRMPSSA